MRTSLIALLLIALIFSFGAYQSASAEGSSQKGVKRRI